MKKLIFLLTVVLFFGACEKANEAATNSPLSRGGSMARFLVTLKALYIVDNSSLRVYDISDPKKMISKTGINLGWDIETIFSFGDKLFIGSRTGMYIYSISDPFNPLKLGQALHLRSCDPVVANAKYAFVTLRSGAACGTATDGLYIYNIEKSITNPSFIKTFELPSPYGLALNGNDILYINQGNKGMSVIDIKDPKHPKVLKTITDYEFMDSIVEGDLLISYISTGIALFDVSDPSNPVFKQLIANK